MNWKYDNTHRKGDHICYITDMSKFKDHYSGWKKKHSLKDIIGEIIAAKSK